MKRSEEIVSILLDSQDLDQEASDFLDSYTRTVTIYLKPEEELSDGTSRAEDIVPALLGWIRRKNPHDYDQLALKFPNTFKFLSEFDSYDMRSDEFRDGCERLEDFLQCNLLDKMQKYCPPGHYFGSHPGCGSCLGCWENEKEGWDDNVVYNEEDNVNDPVDESVAILESRIRGEYWIQGGDVTFADGDIGDMNHEAYAIQHALCLAIDYFGGETGDDLDVTTLEEAVLAWAADNDVTIDPDEWIDAAREELSRQPDSAERLEVFNCALGHGDAREVAMRYWGWKWCRGNNIATWTFTPDDRRSIASGVDNILDSEGFDDDDEEGPDVDLSIGVGSTGKHYNMTLDDLKSGSSPSSHSWDRA